MSDEGPGWTPVEIGALLSIVAAFALIMWVAFALWGCAIAIGDRSDARVNTSAPVEVEARKREEPKH